QVVKQHKLDDDIGYERDAFCYANKAKIAALVRAPEKLKAFPTKYSSKVVGAKVTLAAPRSFIRTAVITVDQFDSFARVKKIKRTPPPLTMSESRFKRGVQHIIGDTGRFKDWGGETSDLWTT